MDRLISETILECVRGWLPAGWTAHLDVETEDFGRIYIDSNSTTDIGVSPPVVRGRIDIFEDGRVIGHNGGGGSVGESDCNTWHLSEPDSLELIEHWVRHNHVGWVARVSRVLSNLPD